MMMTMMMMINYFKNHSVIAGSVYGTLNGNELVPVSFPL